jgi:putative tributyrin esterase
MAWFQVSFFSECLSRSVTLNVLIPADNYGPAGTVDTGDDFRTLYLLHGYAGNCTDWLLNAQVCEMSQQYRLAVVMPNGCNGFYVDQPKSGVLGSTFIGRELVDFTRKVFPLSGSREDTILGGLSMGGYGTLYNAFRHSDVFGHAIALSAPIALERVLDASKEPPELGLHPGYFEALHGDLTKIMETDRNLELSAKTLLDSGGPLPELYIACGEDDMLVPESRKFCAYLRSIGFPCFYEEGPGTHEWTFWNTYLRRGLGRIIPEGPELLPNPFRIDSGDTERGVI